MQRRKLSRRGRWAVPGAAVLVTGAAIAGSQISAAQAAPALPARTPAQLLADVAANHTVPPLTGTVVETTSLGLPALPQTGDPTSLSSLLTGSHTVKVYYQSPKDYRLQIPQTMSETDIIREGNTVWLWGSTQNTVTKFIAPQGHGTATQVPRTPAFTPQQAAAAVLKAVGATTTVRVQSNVDVAGEAAYQLVLAPKDSQSLVGQVVIAIDGKTGVPLRVQVFARGATSPAFQVGYTLISYTAPAPANLQFTPPPGAKLSTVNMADDHARGTESPAGTGTAAATFGSGWLTVAEFPQSDLSSNGTGAGSSPQVPAGSGALGGESQAVLNALLGSAKPVSGAWGSGTLLRTSLVSVLMTRGEVFVGAVQPSVLYSAAQQAAAGHGAG
jgi:outer membrane lipoprotein-sorting protein